MSNVAKDAVYMGTPEGGDMAAVIQAGVEIGASVGMCDWEGRPLAIIPPGWSAKPMLELMDEKDLPRKRVQEYVNLSTVDSFLNYLQRFRTEETVIFANGQEQMVRADIDYHDPLSPHAGAKKHTVTMIPRENWKTKAWKKVHNVKMSQEELIEFLLERAADVELGVGAVSGADLLEIARTLQATGELAYESATRLQNGTTTLVYRHTIQAKAGERGQLEIPERFRVALPLGIGGGSAMVEVLLRFRIGGDKQLTFTLKLLGLQDAEQQAWDAVVRAVSQNLLDIPVYIVA